MPTSRKGFRTRKNGIAEFCAKEIRESDCIIKLSHTPSLKNKSHCSIFGIEAEVRIALSKIAKWSKGFEL